MSDAGDENPSSAEQPRSKSSGDGQGGQTGQQTASGAQPPMLLEVQEEYVPCFFRYVTVITRVAGIVTVIVLWVITGHMLGAGEGMGTREWYMLALSVSLTLFESLWMINKCASKLKNEGCICACWRVCIWFDNWKKTILYVAITIPCLVAPIVNPKTIIAAILIFVTSVFYFLRSFKDSGCVRRTHKRTARYTDQGDLQTKLVHNESQTEDAATEAPANGADYKSIEH